MKKEIGVIGLGRMGGGLAHQLLDKGWKITGYNRSKDVIPEFRKRKGFKETDSVEELVAKLPSPKVVWVMVSKSGVDEILFGKAGLINHLKKGDIVVEGGNSYYQDTIKRGQKFAKKGIEFIDAGVSGGPGGARNGACVMAGGKTKIFKKVEPIFRDISIKDGYKHFPGVGAGHFVKMVHNGIEYGMMQAIAEGFALMKKSPYKLNLIDVTDIYQHRSVVESRLVGWLQDAFKLFGQDLKAVSGKVGHTGEGEWTVKAAEKMGVPVKVIKDSFEFRVKSQKNPSYAGKILSAMRNQFGHHKIDGKIRDA